MTTTVPDIRLAPSRPAACCAPACEAPAHPLDAFDAALPRRTRAYSAPPALASPGEVAPVHLAPTPVPKKKKILVFTVSAGGGHLTAADAISRALGSTYDVLIDKPIEAGAREYNHMMGMGWNGPLNLIGALQDVAEQTLLPLTAGAPMGAALDRHKPDLVISVLTVRQCRCLAGRQGAQHPHAADPHRLGHQSLCKEFGRCR